LCSRDVIDCLSDDESAFAVDGVTLKLDTDDTKYEIQIQNTFQTSPVT